MDEQQKAVNKLSKLKCGALFMEMGSGKTKVALDIIQTKIHKIDYILWICPVSLKNEIEAERIKWHPDMCMHIVGCESLASSDRIYAETLRAIQGKKVFCVVDESLKIKNIKAKRTKRILEIGAQSEYRLILNGTPTSRQVTDLYTQMQFLSPLILNMSYRHFCHNYIEYKLDYAGKKYPYKNKNLDHLTMLIEPYIFDSRLEIDVYQKYTQLWYQNEFSEEYQTIKDDILSRAQYDDLDFYEMCSRLQRCYTRSSEKYAIIESLQSEIDDKVIVFVKYLSSIPAGAMRITGNENMSKRKQILNDFKDDKFKILYMTYGVGAYGLNLQFCNNIIFSEHTFDYAQKIQAEYRIYRIGQQKDVAYYDICCDCGLEKIIINCIDKKENLLNTIKKLFKEGAEYL